MEIDLTKLPYGQCESWNDEQQLRSSHIIKLLKPLSGKWNQLIFSPATYNTLEKNVQFRPIPLNSGQLGTEVKVGVLFNWDCFVNLEMRSNILILQWNLQKKREFKLDSLLNNSKPEDQQLVVNLIDY